MNRQVPETIAIIGNGKVARHMVHYFELIGQPYTQWSRNATAPHASKLAQFKHNLKRTVQSNQEALNEAISHVERVLILIPDDQIEQFIASHPTLTNKTCIHFSGSLNTTLAVGCHPLMTFGEQLYDLNSYQNMHFVIDEGLDFNGLFPLFKNPFHYIKAEHKAIYHAYCVMAGNFSQMLWQAVSKELPAIDLPADVMSQYLRQNTDNFISDPEKSATGPLVRGDLLTIQKHQQALHNHELAHIYQAFVNLHQGQMTEQHRQSS